MERPRYINYQGFTDSKLLNYSIDQDNYIDQLEQENSGLKVQMRALQEENEMFNNEVNLMFNRINDKLAKK